MTSGLQLTVTVLLADVPSALPLRRGVGFIDLQQRWWCFPFQGLQCLSPLNGCMSMSCLLSHRNSSGRSLLRLVMVGQRLGWALVAACVLVVAEARRGSSSSMSATGVYSAGDTSNR